jgi:catechol 2,3-dioxygenase-like lactoylglutathione lyase family enzyme
MAVKVAGGLEVGVVIRDPERMLAFYRDYLGLPLEKEVTFPGVHLYFLQFGDAYVKLVHLDHPPEDANPPGGMRSATGLRYVELEIHNVHEIAEHVAEGGGKLVRLQEVDILTMALLEDPEGNHVAVRRWH